LAQYVSEAQFDALPSAVVESTTALLEDTLGCALGALAMPEARLILSVAHAHSGSTEATAIGGPRTSACAAAFCNSQLANLLDFDDVHDSFSPFHLGCLIVPAALATAEVTGATGRDFLTAVTVAYEVAMRVGRGLGDGLWKQRLPHMALTQLGPAIAAAKLRELDAAAIRSLLSIVALGSDVTPQPGRIKGDVPAVVRIGNLKSNFGTHVQAGIDAAVKARAGLNGFPGFLEWELADWYRAGLPDAGYESITALLGREHVSTRMSLKPTPSCRWTHPSITAAWNALGGRRLDAAHVARVRVFGVRRLEKTQWSSIFDAQYSLPCALALAMSGIEPGPAWYLNDRFRAPEILELAGKISQESDAAAELLEMSEGRMSCRVEIVLQDGRTLSGECRAVKGSPEFPLTSAERVSKFDANARHLPDRGRLVHGAIQCIARAAAVTDLSEALRRCIDREPVVAR
jgi:2-methylcitrate dehydratase PrpD